jgi:hypothetical protein
LYRARNVLRPVLQALQAYPMLRPHVYCSLLHFLPMVAHKKVLPIDRKNR